MKRKFIFAMHMSPPVHGASLMGDMVMKIINEEEPGNHKFLNLSSSRTVDDYGRLSLLRMWRYLLTIVRALYLLLMNRNSSLYITPAYSGLALLRDFFLVFIKSKIGGRVVLHFHSNRIRSSYDAGGMYKYLIGSILRGNDVIFLSYWHSDQFSSELRKSIRNSFVLNNCSPFENKAIESRITGSRVKLLFLSNLIKEKGVFDVLDFARLCKLNGKKYRFVFAGAWPDDETESLFNVRLREWDLQDTVSLVGAVGGEKKHRLLLESDYLLFPTRYESEVFPLVVLEAMNYGLPVVATNHASIPEMVDNSFSFLVGKTMSDDFASICSWIDGLNLYATRSESAVNFYNDNYSESIFSSRLREILGLKGCLE